MTVYGLFAFFQVPLTVPAGTGGPGNSHAAKSRSPSTGALLLLERTVSVPVYTFSCVGRNRTLHLGGRRPAPGP